jgi:hypothetical protein
MASGSSVHLQPDSSNTLPFISLLANASPQQLQLQFFIACSPSHKHPHCCSRVTSYYSNDGSTKERQHGFPNGAEPDYLSRNPRSGRACMLRIRCVSVLRRGNRGRLEPIQTDAGTRPVYARSKRAHLAQTSQARREGRIQLFGSQYDARAHESRVRQSYRFCKEVAQLTSPVGATPRMDEETDVPQVFETTNNVCEQGEMVHTTGERRGVPNKVKTIEAYKDQNIERRFPYRFVGRIGAIRP